MTVWLFQKIKLMQVLIVNVKYFSEISKLYDPLSLCLPLTIQSKIPMRDVWALKVEKDEVLPQEIIKR